VIYLEKLLNAKLEMALLSSFGLISGMTTSYKLNTHDYSPSQRIRISQLHSSIKQLPGDPVSSSYLRTSISRVSKHSRLYSNNSSSSQYKRFLAIHLGKQDLLFLKVLQSPLQERPTSCSVHLGLGFQMFQ